MKYKLVKSPTSNAERIRRCMWQIDTAINNYLAEYPISDPREMRGYVLAMHDASTIVTYYLNQEYGV